MKKIALTGGIATGKSTVLRHWAGRTDARVAAIESDQLVHETYRPDTAVYAAVVQAFGGEILHPDRSINRRRLGEIVFGNDQKRLTLNRIVHPAVRRRWEEELRRLATGGETDVAVVGIPLLFEVGAEKDFDCVVAVGCGETTQLERLAKLGLSAEQARARMRAQWPLATKLDRADYVVWNDGQLDALQQQADVIWKTIQEEVHAATQGK